MNKIGFVFSGIFTVIGIVTLLITGITNKIMPKIGRVAFQAAMKGSYSPDEYTINFGAINFFAFLFIIGGIILGYRLYAKEAKGE